MASYREPSNLSSPGSLARSYHQQFALRRGIAIQTLLDAIIWLVN